MCHELSRTPARISECHTWAAPESKQDRGSKSFFKSEKRHAIFSTQETRPKEGSKHRKNYGKGGYKVPFRQQATGQRDQNREGEGEREGEGKKDTSGWQVSHSGVTATKSPV